MRQARAMVAIAANNEHRVAEAGERLTWDEICARYPDQWVVLVEVDYADAELIDVRSAIVAGAGGDRESFAQAAPILANYEMATREHTRAPDARREWALGHMLCLSRP